MLRLWHNPRCSKSRAALKLLEERGIAAEIYRYLDAPPDREMLDALLSKLGKGASEIARKGEAAWKAAGIGPDSPEEVVREAMISHPILIERPILETSDNAVVGRPPEAILDLI